VPQGAAALDLPVFTGRFWGRVTRRTSLGRVTVSLRVERLIRPPAEPKAPRRATDLEIREIVLPDDIAAGAVPTVSVGRAPVPGKEMRDARGRRTYALDPPLRLAVGQRLDVTFR
jgi:hypothetical protein